MDKNLAKMIEYHNSVSRVLKIHFRGCRVTAYLSNGSKVYGEVSVKDDHLYINGQMVENEIITELYYTDRKRNGGN